MSTLAWIGLPLLVLAAAHLAFGIALCGRRARRNPLACYAALLSFSCAPYCLFAGLTYIRASLGLDYDFYYRGCWVGWLGVPPVMQLAYALRADSSRPPSLIGWLLYPLWGVIWILCLTSDWFEAGAVSLLPFVDRVGPLENAARMLGAALLAWALYQLFQVRRRSTGIRRQQTGYFLLGLSLYAFGGLLMAGLFQVLWTVHFDPALVAYFSLPWVALSFYAITRHRLFDLQVVISRAVYSLTLAALVVSFHVGTFRLLERPFGSLAAILVATLGTAVLLLATPLIRVLRRWTSLLVRSERYDYQKTLKESAHRLVSLHSVDAIVSSVVEILQRVLGVGHVTLVLDAPDGSARLARCLIERQAPIVREEESGALRAELDALDAEVVVPLFDSGALDGLLLVGAKNDGDAFVQSDLDLLETLASQAAVALENARLLEELRGAVRVREDFLSVAGHELKTPLTSLQLHVQYLLRMGQLPERVQERLTSAQRQVVRLNRLIGELLDVSRISAGRMELQRERCDLCEAARDVCGRLTEELTRAGTLLEIEAETPVVGTWDRGRVELVVSNLVSNAIKYGKGQPIHITVDQQEGRARLMVHDHGIGIGPEDQHRIFDRFERAVSNRHYGGLGLGLWIVKEIVDAHAGRIGVESSAEQGTIFTVELPLGAS
jgi:signal transduction histidine kinase